MPPKQTRIYLAAPYSHPDPKVRESRYKMINRKVVSLMHSEGAIIYSPITHCHPLARDHKLPMGYEYWDRNDRCFIKWCNLFVVFMLPGWNLSVGIKNDLLHAKRYHKLIRWDR